MKKLLFLLPIFIGLIFSSCRKEMDISEPPWNLKMMTYFAFKQADNPHLTSKEYKGVIDEYKKTVTVKLPVGVDVTNLKPDLVIGPRSSVSPGRLIPQDFSNPVDYTVTAENGTSVYYTVTVVLK